MKFVDIEFHSVDDTPSPGRHDYHIYYNGGHLKDAYARPEELRLDPEDGIRLQSIWHRGPYLDSDFPRALGSDISYSTRMFVPIPASLFRGRECRYFKMKAKLTFEGCDVPLTVAHSGTVKISIEHLRKEVHMDGRRASLDV